MATKKRVSKNHKAIHPRLYSFPKSALKILGALHPDDWRRRHPEYQQPRLARNLALRDRMRGIATRRGTSVEAVAIAWVLSWPQVTGAIVGASRAGHVDAWLPAQQITLTKEELDEIAAAVNESGAGSGPVRPSDEPHSSTTRT